MIKKSRNHVRKKKVSAKIIHVKTSNTEKILVENFVSLQRVMTNLSLKFDNLASQISKLLELFEISAKTLVNKDFSLEKGDKENKGVIAKLDNLIGQNKIIARGLTLMHEANSPRINKPQHQKNSTTQGQNHHRQQPSGVNEYQKSISSNKKDAPPKY